MNGATVSCKCVVAATAFFFFSSFIERKEYYLNVRDLFTDLVSFFEYKMLHNSAYRALKSPNIMTSPSSLYIMWKCIACMPRYYCQRAGSWCAYLYNSICFALRNISNGKHQRLFFTNIETQLFSEQVIFGFCG